MTWTPRYFLAQFRLYSDSPPDLDGFVLCCFYTSALAIFLTPDGAMPTPTSEALPGVFLGPLFLFFPPRHSAL